MVEKKHTCSTISTEHEHLMEAYVPGNATMNELIANILTRNYSSFDKPTLCLGPGPGDIEALILEKIPTATLLLVDSSEEMINLCQNRFSNYPNISYEQLSFTEFFENNTEEFSHIIAGMCLHCLDDEEVKQTLQHIYEALSSNKKGALFFWKDSIMLENEQAWQEELGKRFQDGIHTMVTQHQAKQEEQEKFAQEMMRKELLFDHPRTIEHMKQILIESGFATGNIIVRHRQSTFAVLQAIKPEEKKQL